MNSDPQKQFVISEHTTPDGVHWDLMLEMDDVLWTWRLNSLPEDLKNKPIPAERIHDHPLRFLTYEGPVQNGTGNVMITEKGSYNIIEETDTILTFDLNGNILCGRYSMSSYPETSSYTLQRL